MSVFSDCLYTANQEYLRLIAKAVYESWKSQENSDEIQMPHGIEEDDWNWCLGYARALQDMDEK